jgi:hypothetical protein
MSNTRKYALDWFKSMDNDTFQHYVLKYESLLGSDRQLTTNIKMAIYTAEMMFPERMYKAEHLNNEPENKEGKEDNPVLSNVEGEDLPNYIKREFIEAAKEYSSHTNESVTINNPDKYKHFRNGQDAAYKILKERIKVLEDLERSFYMNICRAYNAGKRNMNNQHQAAKNGDPGGESEFVSSNDYFISEFPEFTVNVP